MTTLGVGRGSGTWNVGLSAEDVVSPDWLADSSMVGSKLELPCTERRRSTVAYRQLPGEIAPVFHHLSP